MSVFDKLLGRRIKGLREKRGFSQESLSKVMKIGRVSLSQLENGERKISAEEIKTFSNVFNMDADVLLGRKKEAKVVLEKGKAGKVTRKQETRISVPQKKIEKFKAVLLYILNKVGSKNNIGETVIYKLLYFIDFNYYERYEEQLMGATYMKNTHGPTPLEFKKITDSMEGKELTKCKIDYFKYPQTKYLPLKKPDISVLKATEIEVIEDVLKKLSDMNANEISEYSHKDVPWMTTEDGERIDYESVFYRTMPYSVRTYDEENI